MTKIKFGTDGWRAVIAQDFTVDNVARVSIATGKWLLGKERNPVVVVGHDCRFGGKLFAETVAKVLASMKIKVLLAEGFVSTPMISLGIVKHSAHLGVVITASHNPPGDNGYKLKGSYGGPLMESDTRDIENMIPDEIDLFLDGMKIDELVKKGLIQIVDLETTYIEHLKSHFDIKAISNSGFGFAFDAMFGAGQNVFKRIMPEIHMLHCTLNPLFNNIPPEPLHRNLGEFSQYIKDHKDIHCGLAVDGDADRIAMYDEDGKYIDSHHIILLLIHYLKKYKNIDGKVVTGFSSTVKVEKLAETYGLKVLRVRIGFKDICKVMLTDDVLVGGEESGGISIKGHIPERDGIWMGLTLWQFMVESGKTIKQIIKEIYDITGEFAFERSDLRIDPELKKNIVQNCNSGTYKAFGKYQVQRVENLDGYKYFFSENRWLMIRPSGTEPVLRTYAEAEDTETAKDILAEGYKTIVTEK
ncbi:MAG: phosphoglucosamine mutase [Bacteroidetes bacterium GWF2_38_335]|nr:MAG: phosphoglucosamine mutase [Bacteroidetes bacterium GWF2_38_335]OFY78507.1 MAG: phosphoglucosamine mutase [Bacteroidetes bacterium RIFOXYA12_FULL_38_20]HBS88456.1 phosphoglucosamine mutase [Bacteroidales bacterium]